MPKFRKKPVVINAFQWTGKNYDALLDFLASAKTSSDTKIKFDLTQAPPILQVHTLESTSDPLTASEGDWVIVGVKGEVYPCKPDIFEATYEPVPEEALHG